MSKARRGLKYKELVGDLWIDKQKFWSAVDITGPDDCWLWRGALHKQGYGMVSCRDTNDKRMMATAHRVSWRLHTGVALPSATKIIHNCQNPACVNPAHLKTGATIGDIIKIKKANGTFSRCGSRGGVQHPQHNRTYIYTIEHMVYAYHHTAQHIMNRFGFTKEYSRRLRKVATGKAGYVWFKQIVDNYDQEGKLLPGKTYTFEFERQQGVGGYLFDNGGF